VVTVAERWPRAAADRFSAQCRLWYRMLVNSRDRVAVGVWSGVAVGWLLLTWLWSGLHLAMTVDDTYYYFKIAFNASRGLGSTFDCFASG